MKTLLKRISFLTLALLMALAPVAQAAALVTPVVDKAEYETQVAAGSYYTVTAKLDIRGGTDRVRYSEAFGVSVIHEEGKTTSYLATRTMQRTQDSTSSISGGSCFGSAFVAMARNQNLGDRAYCSMIAGQYYYIDASFTSGTYDFRVAFPGATVSRKVERISSYGASTEELPEISYAPSTTTAVVVPYKIG